MPKVVANRMKLGGLAARFFIDKNNCTTIQRAFSRIPDEFMPIEYNQLKARHTTQKGISPIDDSVQIVGLNADYKDQISSDGSVIRYMISAFDNKGNAWLDRSLDKTVRVFLNLSNVNRYYYCGLYRVGRREQYYWTLTRIG